MNILVLSGLDPSGGAGLLRDISAIQSQYIPSKPIHVFGVATMLTAQNTKDITAVEIINSTLIWRQVQSLLKDYEINIIKIGAIDNTHLVVIRHIINTLNIPVILDPIISSSSAYCFDNIDALRQLIPLCTVITPNYGELMALTSSNSLSSALLAITSKYTLLTTTDISDTHITHKLYSNTKHLASFTYKKLAHHYHGSGCTLASLLATKYLHNGIKVCCQYALDATYQTLVYANFGGKYQLHPNTQMLSPTT